MKALRLYQKEAVSATWKYWRENSTGVPLLVCPTGAGKSLIISEICRKVLDARSHYRIIIVSHRKEIIGQNAQEIWELTGRPVGIFSAGLGQRTVRNITCANIQSIYKRTFEANLVIVDECHLLSGKENSMYGKFIEKIQRDNPRVKFLGLTATPFRVDQGALVGDNSFFTDIVYDIDVRRLIDENFLTPVTSRPSKAKIDLSGIRTSGYEYNQEDLEAKFSPMVAEHVLEMRPHIELRKHTLLFCSGVSHAISVSDALNHVGISADYVTGDMLPMERDRKLNDFKSGRIKCLVNCEILTTGFNFPALDCIVFLRATKSTSLYIQIVGRGMRTSPGKHNCLVLDFGRNIERHGPIDCIQIKRKAKNGKIQVGIAPIKECPSCGVITSIRTLTCVECGFEFPISSTQEPKPSEAPILSEIEDVVVEGVHYKKHEKPGKPPSFRVIYKLGDVGQANQFICFEHGGFATRKAQEWWRQAFDRENYVAANPEADSYPTPRTTDQAIELSNYLKKPTGLRIAKKKYNEVLSVTWKVKEFEPYDPEENPYNL